MARELWLLRHGKAHRYDGIEDYDRTLKRRGKRSAIAIGGWLNDHKLAPDSVISSPALRAYGTAKIVCAELGVNPDKIIQDKRLYDEGLVRVKSVLADVPEQFQRVLLVGHNPELEDLLFYISDPGNLVDAKKPLPTAALVRLQMPNDWTMLDKNCATLISVIYPSVLLNGEDED